MPAVEAAAFRSRKACARSARWAGDSFLICSCRSAAVVACGSLINGGLVQGGPVEGTTAKRQRGSPNVRCPGRAPAGHGAADGDGGKFLFLNGGDGAP
jgi:hypothetical protein